MKPKDIKNSADVARWLRSHIEWNDEASRDMMLAAVDVLEPQPKADSTPRCSADVRRQCAGMKLAAPDGGEGKGIAMAVGWVGGEERPKLHGYLYRPKARGQGIFLRRGFRQARKRGKAAPPDGGGMDQ